MSPDPGDPFTHDSYTEQRSPLRFTAQDIRAWASAEDTRERLSAELGAVRSELARLDNKVNTKLTVCGLVLSAAVTVLGTSYRAMGPLATAAGCTAAAIVVVALVLLLLTARPNLSGNFGFVRWARMGSGQGVLDALAGDARADHDHADEVYGLSALLYRKYLAVRYASMLLVAGVGVGVITAVLAVVAR